MRAYQEIKAQNIRLWGRKREKNLSKNIIKHLPVKSGRMLEVGCGDGYLLHRIQEKNNIFRLFALDISFTRLQHTKNNVPNLQLIQAEIDKLPICDDYFDIVICSEVLEHVFNYEESLLEIFRVTKKEGYVFITVPNNEVLQKDVCPHCNRIFYKYGHIRSFDKQGLIESVSTLGQIVKCLELGSNIGKRLERALLRKSHKEPYLFCIIQQCPVKKLHGIFQSIKE